MKAIIILLLSTFALLTITSCSSTPGTSKKQDVPAASPQTETSYAKAKSLYEKGAYNAVLKQTQAQLKSQPQSSLTDDALILRGKTYFKLKQYKAAYISFEKVFKSPYISPRENESRILAIKTLAASGRQKKALKLTQVSLKRKLSKKEKAYLLELRLPTLLKSNAQLEVFEALAFLSQNHPNSVAREKYYSMAKQQIDNRLSPEDLKGLTTNYDLGEFRVEAMFQYAVELIDKGDLNTAKTYFRRVKRAAPSSYLGQQSGSMIKQLEARSFVEAKKIGVVLPLSGPYKSIGEQVLRGIKFSLGIMGTKSEYGIELAIRDSQGESEVANAAVEELVLKEHVIAIIGGLTSKTAMAEVTKSQSLGTPLLALSQTPGLTKVGPLVFRATTTPRMQVQSLVKVAMEKYGFKRFAILYPNDKYGVEYSNLFWDEVLRHGGKITAAQTYQAGEADFKDHVRKMVGTYYLEDRKGEYKQLLRMWRNKHQSRRKRPPEDLLPPIVEFDALFIPDSPKAIGQIAPMLAFNNVRNVHLLGTNLWNSPDFIRRGQNFVRNSLFQDTFLSNSREFKQSSFFRTYRNIYQSSPGIFSVLGYDAATLLLASLKKDQPKNRIALMRSLLNIEPTDGAVSEIAMNKTREIQRPLVSLTVDKEEIVLIDQAQSKTR